MTVHPLFDPFPLSPLDHIVPRVNLSFHLTFKPKAPGTCVRLLRNGVRALVYEFPFLAGNVVQIPETVGKRNVLHIFPPACPLEEVSIFSVKYYTINLPPKQSFKNNACAITETNRQLSPLPVFIPSSQPQPVLRFQANVFADGIILAMSLPHAIMDATGAGRILEMLAQYCAEPRASLSPSELDIQNEMRRAIFNVSVDTRYVHDHSLETNPTGIPPEMSSEEFSKEMSIMASSLTIRRLVFPAAKVMQLRNWCNQLLSGLGDCEGRNEKQAIYPSFISRNDVLSSFLALSIEKARRQLNGISASTTPMIFSMSVNMRERIPSPTAKNYLGCMVNNLVLETRVPDQKIAAQQQIRHGFEDYLGVESILSITHVAAELRQKLSTMDGQYFSSFVSHIREQEDWSRKAWGMKGLDFTSWRHLNTYGIHFGTALGKITDFEPSFGTWDGALVVLPSLNPADRNECPWEVHVTVKSDVLDLMTKDRLFCWLLADGDST